MHYRFRRTKFVFGRPLWLAVLMGLSCALAASCADGHLNGLSGIRSVQALLRSSAGTWVLHVNGGEFSQHVQIVRMVLLDGDVLNLESVPSRGWDGTPVHDLDVQWSSAYVGGGAAINWGLTLADGRQMSLRYTLVADTLRGALTVPLADSTDATYPVFGVRIDESLLTPPLEVNDTVPSDSTPLVVLRVDDNMPTDPAFTSRLIARSIPAEIAVPTASVGVNGRPTWADLHDLESAGFGIVAHSRLHVSTTGDGVDFMGEVLGSLEDLARHGFSSRDFVQPGVWTDSIFFDSTYKTQSWRGALLRTFTASAELYQINVPLLRPWGWSRIGISHRTISDGATTQDLQLLWLRVQRKNYLTVLLVHTLHVQPPDMLDWFLDSLSAANRSGRIHLMRSIDDAYAR